MLSRVAERTYWFGRYMERIENTARLMTVNAQLLLDLPRGIRLGWESLIDITGLNEAFFDRYQVADERNVVRFLLSNAEIGSSIAGALRQARENVRTSRDMLPSEVWELINDLFLYVNNHVESAVARRNRQSFLVETISRCQQLTGLIEGGLAYNPTRDFIIIGRSLERADMTTRILNVGTINFLATHSDARNTHDQDMLEPLDNALWMSVLRSLSAYQMYRQHVRERVNGQDVVAFMLQNGMHPRSVVRCLSRLDTYFENLPNSDHARLIVSRGQKLIWDIDINDLLDGGLHDFIDELQRVFAAIHDCVAATWFLPPRQ